MRKSCDAGAAHFECTDDELDHHLNARHSYSRISRFMLAYECESSVRDLVAVPLKSLHSIPYPPFLWILSLHRNGTSYAGHRVVWGSKSERHPWLSCCTGA